MTITPPDLRQSEALTRYALIDPLLRELGWDTANPNIVIPEYRSGNGRADYALMNGDKPAMMVEAKSLDTPLGAVLSQGIQYCLEQGTRFFCVTDGRIWEIYETHKPVPLNDKRITHFDLKDNPAQVCLKALALWRPSALSGQVSVGQAPILNPTQVEPGANPAQPTTTVNPVIHPPPVAPPQNPDAWQPLPEFNAQASPRPAELLFPDNSTAPINYWKSIVVEVTRWLVNNNILRPHHCPIPSSSRGYIVSATPVHPTGNQFHGKEQVGSLFVDTHANASGHIRKTLRVIERVGQDPSQFKVRLP